MSRLENFDNFKSWLVRLVDRVTKLFINAGDLELLFYKICGRSKALLASDYHSV